MGDDLEICGLKAPIKTTCIGVEMFKKSLKRGEAGDNCGILLRGVKRDDIARGQVRTLPKKLSLIVNLLPFIVNNSLQIPTRVVHCKG